ncbi:MAG TPA: PQQ-dependent sugar dehydrogenase [Polyangiaceae bacterium]
MRSLALSLLVLGVPLLSSCGEKSPPDDAAAGTAGTPVSGTGGTLAGGGSGGSPPGGAGSGGATGGGGNSAAGTGGSTGGTPSTAGSGGTGSGGAGSGSGGAGTGGTGESGSAGQSGSSSGSAGSAGGPPACDASAKPVVGGIGLSTVFSSNELVGASYAVQAPGSDDWYFVEQRGRIRVLAGGALKPAVFYDVSSEITLDTGYDERGLHSIAFPPDYAESGLFYVVLTPTTGARANRDLVLEHRRSTTDPYVADMAVTREILNLEGVAQSGLFSNLHNAYMAKFGPDDMLYVGMGDGGGSCNDNPGFQDSPQDIANPHGKLLRFDLAAAAPYGAADNPFVADGDPRVLHYGLRNPFRFGWDRVTSDLYIGDVGQDTHEELNAVPKDAKGINFGWASEEGDEGTCPARALRPNSTVTKPIFFSTHGGGSGLAPACSTSPFCDFSSIVAGAVYRGSAMPALYGMFLFGDWASDNMAALYHCGEETSEVTSIDYVRDANLPDNGYLVKADEEVPDLESITAIVEDHAGELHVMANGNSLLKLVPAP